jgi:predicted aspartyl protease
MASTSFPSLDAAEVIEVEFVRLDGSTRMLRMLVDTVFTGKSSLIVAPEAVDLIRARLPRTQTSGALRGAKRRAWVKCCIRKMKFEATMIAIIADLSSLALPAGVDGLIGLSFLRHFARWGGYLTRKKWAFKLVDRED